MYSKFLNMPSGSSKSSDDQQYDPRKLPIWTDKKADLDDWEILAKFYLDRQAAVYSKPSWTLIRDDDERAIERNPLSSDEIRKAQRSCWELLFQTFYKYKKTVLTEHAKHVSSPAHPEWATEAWKAIYKDYAGNVAVEVLQLTTQLNTAKYFTGEFDVWIDNIINIQEKLTALKQGVFEPQLVSDVLTHMQYYVQNSHDPNWANFPGNFRRDHLGKATYTLSELKEAGKVEQAIIESARAIDPSSSSNPKKRGRMAAFGASEEGRVYCDECGDTFTKHCTHCHAHNHFKKTCDKWRFDNRGDVSRGKGRGRGAFKNQRGRGRGHHANHSGRGRGSFGPGRGRGGDHRSRGFPSRGGRGDHRGRGRRPIECFGCGQQGHYRNECPHQDAIAQAVGMAAAQAPGPVPAPAAPQAVGGNAVVPPQVARVPQVGRPVGQSAVGSLQPAVNGSLHVPS